MVMADCCGMSMAISLRLWTYLTLSTKGTKTFKPGSRMRLNLPGREDRRNIFYQVVIKQVFCIYVIPIKLVFLPLLN